MRMLTGLSENVAAAEISFAVTILFTFLFSHKCLNLRNNQSAENFEIILVKGKVEREPSVRYS